MSTHISLLQLGWSPFFQQQLSLEEWDKCFPARVVARHRSTVDLISNDLISNDLISNDLISNDLISNGLICRQQTFSLPITDKLSELTVGDWILVRINQAGAPEFVRMLDRMSKFSRKAAGTKIEEQLIAANVDTAFIVCSLNHDFNLNRIERYLALIHEAGAEPVVVLTKKDQCDEYENYIQQVQKLDPMLMVEAVNGLDHESVEVLKPWTREGKTVALLGSSGVGKSTLVNVLLDKDVQLTSGIREDDSKGRHTTTSRSLHFIQDGGVLLDTPGMRELQIADCEDGVEMAFADIAELATQCRYADCQHHNEPGCAVMKAIEEGSLDQRRLDSYDKLMREQAFNSATLAEKRAKDRAFAKHCRSVLSSAHKQKKGY